VDAKRGLLASSRGFMLPVTRERVEALKPVPQLGTYGADGASGATGYRTKRKEVACCETRFVGPFGYVRTPEMVRVLDRAYANFGELPFHALGWIKTGR
jgi:hypothetical protein